MKHTKKGIIGEAWWIDYMDDDLAEGDRKTMELLLNHSVTDQLILENYRAVKRQIKYADPVKEYEKLLHDPIYLTKLQNQIMDQVELAAKKQPSKFKRFISERWPYLLHIIPQKNL